MPIGSAAFLPAALFGSAGLGAIGSGKSADAASSAANLQSNAANNAARLQYNALQQQRDTLNPFVNPGRDILAPLQSAAVDLRQNVMDQLGPQTNRLADISPFTASVDRVNTVTGAQNVPHQYATTNNYTTPQSFDYGAWGPGGNAQATLESTPGYQFTKEQGLRAVQNSEAAKGRGVSGNALTAAGEYATGLADKTFGEQFTRALQGQGQAFGQTLAGQQQQFNQGIGSGALELQGQQQIFNQNLGSQELYGQQAPNFYNTYLQSILSPQAQRYQQSASNLTLPINSLLPLAGLSANAAAGVGNQIGTAASNTGNLLTSGAAARAGGIVGSTNALTSGFSNAGNSLTNYALLRQLGLLNSGGGDTGGLY